MRPGILIVDDDPMSRALCRALLADCGAELIEAHDGYEALACAARLDLCLVLLDIHMPAMSGYQVATQLRQDARTAHLPIVFVSGMLIDDEPLTFEQRLGDADLFLEKPVEADLLRQVARLFLRLHERRTRGLREARQDLDRLRQENIELRLMSAGQLLRSRPA